MVKTHRPSSVASGLLHSSVLLHFSGCALPPIRQSVVPVVLVVPALFGARILVHFAWCFQVKTPHALLLEMIRVPGPQLSEWAVATAG